MKRVAREVMLQPRKTNRIQALFGHVAIMVVTLVAAEVACMLSIYGWMQKDQGAVVLMGLVALPLWATFLTLVYTAERRLWVGLAFLGVGLVGSLLLYIFS
ncbi:hypothetical protein AAFN60_16420 [Roseibacillus persicicus]|uniref:hypothetical protein n=1 Tax=Roseibacillus persicicus TaxID=454148 RepID=UPI00398AF7AC